MPKSQLEPADFLKMVRLRQYPPRRRTIFLRPYKDRPRQYLPPTTAHFKTPWMSFGEGAWRYDSQYFKECFVWRHPEPWESLDEAANMLYCIPTVHNTIRGGQCLGSSGYHLFAKGMLTAEQVFWQTSFQWNVACDLERKWWDFRLADCVSVAVILEMKLSWKPCDHVEGNADQTENRGGD